MKNWLLVIFCFCITLLSKAQAQDSTTYKKTPAKDSLYKKTVQPFEPRKATIRSAIAPGWGQIYNKKYWKLPLVWGALGTTAGIYFYNVKYYRSLKQAYIYKTDTDQSNDILVDEEFRNLSAESIRSYRNSFRQSVDYSVLFFILFWGLNVVDATVDAHLKAFDVSDDLSLQIKPGYSQLSNTAGISLVLNIGKRK
jgi:Family of unknown function (DUF5683)